MRLIIVLQPLIFHVNYIDMPTTHCFQRVYTPASLYPHPQIYPSLLQYTLMPYSCRLSLRPDVIPVRVGPVIDGTSCSSHQPSGYSSARESASPPYLQNKVSLSHMFISHSQSFSVFWIFSRTKASAFFGSVKLSLSPFHVNLRVAGCANVCFTC